MRNILATISEARKRHAAVTLEYTDAEGDATERTVSAIGNVRTSKAGAFYFTALCHLRTAETGEMEMRSFRVDRIRSVR